MSSRGQNVAVAEEGAVSAHALSERIRGARPSLDRDATINGKLSFRRATRLDGTLRGEVRAESLLVIGETGLVEGTIRAEDLVVLGRVKGDVLETGNVELTPGAVVEGVIEARSLRVPNGARFVGPCRIRPR